MTRNKQVTTQTPSDQRPRTLVLHTLPKAIHHSAILLVQRVLVHYSGLHHISGCRHSGRHKATVEIGYVKW